MCHELLTRCALFYIGVNAKKGLLSQHVLYLVHSYGEEDMQLASCTR